MKLIFASPSHGLIHPKVSIGQRLAMVHAVQRAGVQWMGDVSLHDVKQSTIDTARNRMVERVLETDADAIMWCDSDIVLPQDAISKLVIEEKDFITGIYCQRFSPYYPVVTHYDPDGCQGKGNMNWFVEFPDDVCAPAGGCGFGCVLTSTKMLRAMPRPWFSFGDFSEDFTFCRAAAMAGFQLYVQTGVHCGHIGEPEEVTLNLFRETWRHQHGSVMPRVSAA